MEARQYMVCVCLYVCVCVCVCVKLKKEIVASIFFKTQMLTIWLQVWIEFNSVLIMNISDFQINKKNSIRLQPLLITENHHSPLLYVKAFSLGKRK
jgi:hypothetical protein